MKLIDALLIAGGLALSSLALSSPAIAKTINVAVNGSQKTPIHSIGVYNRSNCSSSPRAKIYRKTAQNGTVTTTNSRGKLEKGVCKGKIIKSVVVYYQAKKGFRGTDTVKVGFSFPAGEDIAFNKGGFLTFKVTVK